MPSDSRGEKPAEQPVDHGGADARLPGDGPRPHGRGHRVPQEQVRLQDQRLQELPPTNQGGLLLLCAITFETQSNGRLASSF